MNPDYLLKHFNRLSEAPDAIPNLRRFILDLAVRGKLVEQNSKDKQSLELLKLVQSGDTTVAGPLGWVSGSFGKLLEMNYGKGLSATDRQEQGKVPVFGSNGVVSFTDTALTNKPAIIIGRKGSAGALKLCDGPSWTTDVAYFLVPPDYFDIRFLFFMLGSLNLGALGKGVKPGLSRSEAYQLSLAIPPLAEQLRIVARVDELMALCDQLEAAKTDREQTRDRLVASSLHSLNEPDASHDHARFTFNNLPSLTTRVEHIKQLRQSILNLAVRGKLVKQDAKDEPAPELLKLIEKEKEKLVKAGKIKKDKPLQPIELDELPFSIPKNWSWVKLSEIAPYIQRGKSPEYVAVDGFPVISQKCVQWDGLDLSVAKLISKNSIQNYEDVRFLRDGDLLWNSTGTGTIGRIIKLTTPLPKKLVCDSHVTVVRCLEVDPEYVRTWLRSDHVYGLIEGKATGSTNQVELTAQMTLNQVVPLPPLAEQHRIVTKVNELMTLCDQLEAQIETTEKDSRRLLEAVLHEALVG